MSCLFCYYRVVILYLITVSLVIPSVYSLSPNSTLSNHINDSLVAQELEFFMNNGSDKQQEIAAKLQIYLYSDKRVYERKKFKETTVLSSSEIDRLNEKKPHLNWGSAANLHWGEMVRNPWKQTNEKVIFSERSELQFLENQRNYLTNQKAVRREFLLFLEKISEDKDIHVKNIPSLLVRLHEILLLGEDRETYYFPINLLNMLGGRIDLDQLRAVASNFNPQASSLNFRFMMFLTQLHVLVKPDTTQEKAIATIAQLYDDFIRPKQNSNMNPNGLYLFEFGNNSLFMNIINTLLRMKGLNELAHGYLDSTNLIQNFHFNDIISILAYKKATAREVMTALFDIITSSNIDVNHYYGLFDYIVYHFNLSSTYEEQFQQKLFSLSS